MGSDTPEAQEKLDAISEDVAQVLEIVKELENNQHELAKGLNEVFERNQIQRASLRRGRRRGRPGRGGHGRRGR